VTLTPREALERRLASDQRNVAYLRYRDPRRVADVIADCAARLVDVRETAPDLEPWAWRNLVAALGRWRSD
jgi:hypothetical protein